MLSFKVYRISTSMSILIIIAFCTSVAYSQTEADTDTDADAESSPAPDPTPTSAPGSEEDSDWDSWFDDDEGEGDGDGGGGDEVDGTSRKGSGSSQPKQKRWTKEGLCDHDLASSIILKLLLDVQPTMRVGDPLLNLPPLDPLSLPPISTTASEDQGYQGAYVTRWNIWDIFVKDLSLFNITDIASDLDSLSANVSFSLNSVRVFGKYNVKGVVKFGIIPLPIFGDGEFNLEFQNIDCFIFAKFALLPNSSIILQEFEFGVGIESMGDVDFTGLMFSSKGSKIFSHIMKRIGTNLFEKLERSAHRKIRERAVGGINRILNEWEYDEEMLMKLINQSMHCFFG